MNIPFVDLKAQYLNIKEDIDKAIANVIQETAFIKGKYVQQFEKEFAELYGVKHCVSVANGTDSLYIIMKMLGIGPGDEVITVANSWISSSETISQTGAKPIFVDIDDYNTIDVTLLEKYINKRTKAILVVHLYGQMADIESIMSIAKANNLNVIEDCAQAHFSEYNGIRAGLRGVAGSFSFYPGKNLGAYGDAGCIITNNDELANMCRMYANHGALVKHNHLIEGINSRLDGLQASILSAKLPHILNWTALRIRNADLYNQYLKDIESLELPKVRPNSVHTFHLYVIKTKDRDKLRLFLQEKNIACEIHYPVPLPLMPAYKYLRPNKKNYPNSIKNQQTILSLPMYPELKKQEIEYIAEQIRQFDKNNA